MNKVKDPKLQQNSNRYRRCKLQSAHPFRLSSGFLSQAILTAERLLHIHQLSNLLRMMIDTINSDMISQSPNYIIGGETAGIPFGAVIAEKMGFPLSYVRKKVKDYGKNKLIEGEIFKEKNSLLVEDLMTDGQSKINFVETINHMVSV